MLGTCPDPPAWDPAVGTVVRTAPTIAQVIAGPPETLIMGALLTSKVVDIAIGYMTSRGMEGRRARHRNLAPAIVTASNTMTLTVPGTFTEPGDITVYNSWLWVLLMAEKTPNLSHRRIPIIFPESLRRRWLRESMKTAA